MSATGKRLAFYAMLAAQFEDNYSKCSCGHFYASEHRDGVCFTRGCGCGVA